MVSLRFEAGFVGVHGEMSGLNLLSGAVLVGLNMLGSHVSWNTNYEAAAISACACICAYSGF